jgi:hypothetical protein
MHHSAGRYNNILTNISYLVVSIAESVYPSPSANQYVLLQILEVLKVPYKIQSEFKCSPTLPLLKD